SDGVSGEVVSQTKALVDKAASSAKERARSSATSGKDMVADTVSCLAQSLTSASQQLKSQQNGASGLVEQAAQQLDRVARQLDDSRVEELVQRGERWARDNPALFLGGVFMVGVLAGRFLKASPPAPQTVSRPS